jgi:hypothetical protein
MDPVDNQNDWESERDALLGRKISELGLSIHGSRIERLVETLYAELAEKSVSFRPPVYLSDQWGCPDGTPLIGVPFYLVDKRLERFEAEMTGAVEDDREAMRYLRHECGHAVNYAFRLYERAEWRSYFGSFSQPYRDRYRADPFSREYVRHILGWYAQKHPDEDFAETFAVWLTPDSPWRKRYQDWPALKKLEFVDGLMREIGSQPPRVTSRRTVDPLRRLRKTLRDYYSEKLKRYGVDYPNVYDRDLRRLFSDAPEHRSNPAAAQFIRRTRREVRTLVARWTGEYQYTIDQVITEIAKRCRELNLRLASSPEHAKRDFTIFVAVQAMHYLHSGRHRVWL